MPTPHIPQDLQDGVRVVVETKYGLIRGGRTTNGAAVFLGAWMRYRAGLADLLPVGPVLIEVPYALPPERFTDPRPLPEGHRYEDKDYIYETKRE